MARTIEQTAIRNFFTVAAPSFDLAQGAIPQANRFWVYFGNTFTASTGNSVCRCAGPDRQMLLRQRDSPAGWLCVRGHMDDAALSARAVKKSSASRVLRVRAPTRASQGSGQRYMT